jgi:hypothetical protein
MRSLFILLFIYFSMPAFAQSQADYQRVMDKFVKFYNKKQGDSIIAIWTPGQRKPVSRLWTKSQIDTLQMKYGKIKSGKYLKTETTQYGNAAFFKTIFSKLEPNGTTFILNKNNQFEAFQLFTSEPKWLNQPKKK